MLANLSFKAKVYIWAIANLVYAVWSLLVEVLFFEFFTPDQTVAIFVYLFFLLHFCFIFFYTMVFYKKAILPRLSLLKTEEK